MDGNTRAFDFAKNFDPDLHNLYLWGPTGQGKSHLAYAIAQKWLYNEKSVELMSYSDFINHFRLNSPEDEKRKSQELIDVDVLVIDDMGIEKLSDFAIRIFCNILNKRQLKNKNGLVITTNLFLDDLSRKSGDDRIANRLAGNCEIIKIETGYDFRTELKKQ